MQPRRNGNWFGVMWPVLAAALAGCALSSSQLQSISMWEKEAADLGHPEVKYVEEMSPATATGLGFLPFGIAGFYVHRPGLAVSGILFWPLSITWTPAVAHSTAIQYNYKEFRDKVYAMREQVRATTPAKDELTTALDRVERLRQEGRISESEYQDSRRRILEGIGRPAR